MSILLLTTCSKWKDGKKWYVPPAVHVGCISRYAAALPVPAYAVYSSILRTKRAQVAKVSTLSKRMGTILKVLLKGLRMYLLVPQGLRRPSNSRVVPRTPNPTTKPAALPNNNPPKIAGTALSPPSLRPAFPLPAFSHEPPNDNAHPSPQIEASMAPSTHRNWEAAPPEAESARGTNRPTVPEPIRSPGDGARAAPYLSYLKISTIKKARVRIM